MLRFGHRLAVTAAFVLAFGGVAHAEGGESGAALMAPPARAARCAVLDTLGIGIDPVVAPHVAARIRATVESLGYTLVPDDARVSAERAAAIAMPPSPADVWRVTFASRAERGLFARVYAASGQYVVEVLVASVDGTGPFSDRATAGANDLLDVVDALVRRLLPAPSSFDADAAARLAEAARPTAPSPSFHVLGPGGGTYPPLASGPPVAPERRLPMRRLAITLGGDLSFGLSEDRFRNGSLDARFELRLSRDFLLLAQFSYANLKGRTQRVSNVLPMLGVETRIRLASDDGVSIPIRLLVGYLPFNGAVLRIAAGLNFPIKERFELGFDLLSPTFWFLGTGRVISFDLALSVTYRFGPIKADAAY